MKVLRVEADHFMLYEVLARDIPGGLTVVTGPNGEGKSSLIEAICWALYGKTIRGTNPQQGKVPCSAGVTLESAAGIQWVIDRKRVGKDGAQLTLRTLGGSSNTGQTPSETQKRIDALCGSYEAFIASRVFSSEHVARFGAATDKGRKALVEAMLGMGQWDRALALVRNDLNLAKRAVMQLEVQTARAEGNLSACVDRAKTIPKLGPEVPPNAEELIQGLLGRILVAKQRVKSLEESKGATAQAQDREGATKTAADRRAKEAATRAEALLERARRSSTADTCPACLRPMVDTDREAIHLHYADDIRRNKDEVVAARLESQGCASALTELAEEAAVLGQDLVEATSGLNDLQTEAGDLQKLKLAADTHARQVRDAQAAIDAARQAHDAKTAELVAAQARMGTLETSEEILGIRGARTLLLDRALKRMEVGANSVLPELGMDFKVKVTGSTTQASGKEVDAISVSLVGAGGGVYAGASRGQRACVDVALLLGLAGIEGTGGFLAFDEVFDSLDPERAERAAQFLGKLVDWGRQILVVTHHDALRGHFPGASTWRVALVDGCSTLTG